MKRVCSQATKRRMPVTKSASGVLRWAFKTSSLCIHDLFIASFDYCFASLKQLLSVVVNCLRYSGHCFRDTMVGCGFVVIHGCSDYSRT